MAASLDPRPCALPYAPGPPRTAQRVSRISSTANIAYMTTPMTATTIRPANTSGTSKRELAATIR